MVSIKERSVLASFGSIIREDPVRAEITKMITCVKATNYTTMENIADETGYSNEESKRGKYLIAIHVVENVSAEEFVFMGLIKREIQKSNPICTIRFDGSSWKIPDVDIHNTEKLSDLYRHLKYFGLKIDLEGTAEEILNRIYIEARQERSGAIDYPPISGAELPKL